MLQDSPSPEKSDVSSPESGSEMKKIQPPYVEAKEQSPKVESDLENQPKEESVSKEQEKQEDFNELRESMKQTQMELNKAKEENAKLQEKYQQAEEEAIICRNNIARQAKLAQSQQKQIESIKGHESKKGEEEVDYSKFRVDNYQRELLIKNAEISSLKQTLATKDDNLCSVTVSHDKFRLKSDIMQKSSNTKEGEIARLKQQLSDLQKELDELYIKEKLREQRFLK